MHSCHQKSEQRRRDSESHTLSLRFLPFSPSSLPTVSASLYQRRCFLNFALPSNTGYPRQNFKPHASLIHGHDPAQSFASCTHPHVAFSRHDTQYQHSRLYRDIQPLPDYSHPTTPEHPLHMRSLSQTQTGLTYSTTYSIHQPNSLSQLQYSHCHSFLMHQ